MTIYFEICSISIQKMDEQQKTSLINYSKKYLIKLTLDMNLQQMLRSQYFNYPIVKQGFSCAKNIKVINFQLYQKNFFKDNLVGAAEFIITNKIFQKNSQLQHDERPFYFQNQHVGTIYFDFKYQQSKQYKGSIEGMQAFLSNIPPYRPEIKKELPLIGKIYKEKNKLSLVKTKAQKKNLFSICDNPFSDNKQELEIVAQKLRRRQ